MTNYFYNKIFKIKPQRLPRFLTESLRFLPIYAKANYSCTYSDLGRRGSWAYHNNRVALLVKRRRRIPTLLKLEFARMAPFHVLSWACFTIFQMGSMGIVVVSTHVGASIYLLWPNAVCPTFIGYHLRILKATPT